MTLKAITSLSPLFQKAAQAAIAVSSNAYAPYSEFHVGAALIHPDGSITVGCNYENSTYQATCAERCAMVAANAAGKRAAVACAVYGASAKTEHNSKVPGDATTPPCGTCRQHMYEICDLSNCDMEFILVSNDKKNAKIVKHSELLPDAFGPTAFGVDLVKYRPSKEQLESKFGEGGFEKEVKK